MIIRCHSMHMLTLSVKQPIMTPRLYVSSKKRVTTGVAVSVATTMLGARLGYCNAILYGTSKSNIHELQRAQNSIASIVTGTSRSENITPVLARLHWLNIAERIEYKVALLTFKALTLCMPFYLSDQLQLCAPVRQLRSSDRKNRLLLRNPRQASASSSAILRLSSGIAFHIN